MRIEAADGLAASLRFLLDAFTTAIAPGTMIVGVTLLLVLLLLENEALETAVCVEGCCSLRLDILIKKARASIPSLLTIQRVNLSAGGDRRNGGGGGGGGGEIL
jgi:hypothetical protein